MVVALVAATAATAAFGLPVTTIGDRFGGIPQSLPRFAWPEFSWELATQPFAPAVTIALLGAIESLLFARVADNLIDDRHDPNQDLMAPGIANMAAPLFGGIPATGTIARTVTNVKSGASSPIAGVVHALTLLAILLAAAPLAAGVPMAVLAAILMFVAFNMGEWREFARLKRFALTYRVTPVATFALTVIVDLTVAVEVGLLLASLFFIYRISTLTRVQPIPLAAAQMAAPDGIEAYRLQGSLFFGAVDKLEPLTDPARFASAQPPRAVVLECSQLLSLDTTTLNALDALRRQLARRGGTLLIACASEQPLSLLQRSGFCRREAVELATDFAAALERARQLAARAPAPAGGE